MVAKTPSRGNRLRHYRVQPEGAAEQGGGGSSAELLRGDHAGARDADSRRGRGSTLGTGRARRSFCGTGEAVGLIRTQTGRSKPRFHHTRTTILIQPVALIFLVLRQVSRCDEPVKVMPHAHTGMVLPHVQLRPHPSDSRPSEQRSVRISSTTESRSRTGCRAAYSFVAIAPITFVNRRIQGIQMRPLRCRLNLAQE